MNINYNIQHLQSVSNDEKKFCLKCEELLKAKRDEEVSHAEQGQGQEFVKKSGAREKLSQKYEAVKVERNKLEAHANLKKQEFESEKQKLSQECEELKVKLSEAVSHANLMKQEFESERQKLSQECEELKAKLNEAVSHADVTKQGFEEQSSAMEKLSLKCEELLKAKPDEEVSHAEQGQGQEFVKKSGAREKLSRNYEALKVKHNKLEEEVSHANLKKLEFESEKQKLLQECEELKAKLNEAVSHADVTKQGFEEQSSAMEKVNLGAKRLHCCDPSGIVDITFEKSGIASREPITIPEFYMKTFTNTPNEKALCWKDNDGQWQSITYTEYKKLIYKVAKSFHKLGLEPYHAVGILGFNSVEWFASSIGAVFAGGLSTGIHTTNSPEVCQYILKDCKAHIVVVENTKLLDTIIKIRDRLPHLKAIVQYKGELHQDHPNTYTWTKFLELGKDTEDSVIDDIINKQQPNQCAVVLYTSGTTGNPKGVMLSHDNFTWSAMAFLETIGFGTAKSTVSYLPSSHMIGTFADMFLPVPVGGTVYFATPSAIEGSLISTMQEV
ncbi:long-chain-fatty-acid--CoA ligase ACSBG2-like [Dysidea avara]|uniref:long-chain-fatty-acid--CoA ligase ACSBG2-like n=1 Tax=Dysidea avara TaxID=196820 RepID=UPI00331B4F89